MNSDGKVHVLIVDDNEDNLFSLRLLLRANKITADVVDSGEKALEKLCPDHNFDVVLMDLMMPGMDGIECSRQIKAQENLRSLPIIAITAHPESLVKAFDVGVEDGVRKPVDINMLLMAIEKVLAPAGSED